MIESTQGDLVLSFGQPSCQGSAMRKPGISEMRAFFRQFMRGCKCYSTNEGRPSPNNSVSLMKATGVRKKLSHSKSMKVCNKRKISSTRQSDRSISNVSSHRAKGNSSQTMSIFTTSGGMKLDQDSSVCTPYRDKREQKPFQRKSIACDQAHSNNRGLTSWDVIRRILSVIEPSSWV